MSEVAGALEIVNIPAGVFFMGAKKKHSVDWAWPQRQVWLDAFEIMKYPLTNQQYKAFLDAAPNHPAPEDWRDRTYPQGKPNHPAINITWHDAQTCAAWYGMQLPTEAQWEKAARGTDARIYPWGDKFDKGKCNTIESGIKDTAPIDRYPKGASPYGVIDMAGNVFEWCADWFDADYYKAAPDRNPPGPETGKAKVLRGGSWYFYHDLARCAYRHRDLPGFCGSIVGVRFSRPL